MSEKLKIVANAMNFTAYPTNPKHLDVLREFSRRFIRWTEYWDKWKKRKVREPVAGHVFFKQDRTEVRAMKGMLPEFIKLLHFQGYREGVDYELVEDDLGDINVQHDYAPTIKEGWSPRGEQQDVIDFCLDGEKGVKLLTLQTGGGKSFIMMSLAERIKQRFVIIMRPTYIGELGKESKGTKDAGWMKDFSKTFDIDVKEICVVQGSSSLKSLINLAKSDEIPYKAIVISNKTLMNFFKAYEEYSKEDFEDLGYGCNPQDLPKVLGVDTFFADEVHQDYHLNCKMFSYFRVKNFFCASATITPDDRFIRKMLFFAFPDESRYKQKNYNVYIQPHAFHYRFYNPGIIRYSNNRGYNHILFEMSIMKKAKVKYKYYEMISSVLEEWFNRKLKKHPEATCVVLCASISMCRDLAKYLNEKYKDIKVTSYVEEDPDENLFDTQICVSTVLSAGTGQDIPNLRTLICTLALGSTQPNIQVPGRLRVLPDNETPDYIYFVATDIPKHVEYSDKKKREIFPGRLREVRNIYSGFVI